MKLSNGEIIAEWAEKIRKLEAENAELKQKLAAGYTAVASGINADLNTELTTAKATIESLNLRVVRLADALVAPAKFFNDEYPSSPVTYRINTALSSESDYQWLRDKIATELKTKS